jgi:ribonuclease P protein component
MKVEAADCNASPSFILHPSAFMNRAYGLRREDFQRVWDNGKSWSHPLVILRAAANGTESNRFGFVAGKKIGKAVRRNRAKRLMREAVRHRLKALNPGWDVILISRAGADQAEFKDIDAAVENILRRAHLIRNS